MFDNQRKLGVVLSYITLLIQAVTGFIYVPLLLHYMGLSEYGLYQLMGSVIAYIAVMDFGLSSTIIRYYSQYKTLKDQSNMENVLALSLLIYSVITVLIITVGTIIYLNLGNIFSSSLTTAELESAKKIWLVLLCNIAITIPSKIFDAVIISHERFVFLKLSTIIQSVIQPLVVIAVMLGYPNALAFVITQTSFNVLLILVKIYYSFSKLRLKIELHNFDRDLIKSMIRFSFFIFLGAIMDQLFWRSNQFILGIITSTSVVAIYGIAMQIFNNYMSLSTVITGVFLPRVTELVTQNATSSDLSELFIRIGRLQFILLSCVLSGFILFGREFITLWSGNEVNNIYWITLLLIIPFTIDLIQNIGITILQALNKMAFRSVTFLIMSIINILLVIPMAIHFGSIGTALATGFCCLIANAVIMNTYYSKRIHIDIGSFWLEIAKISCYSIICTIIGSMLNLYFISPLVMDFTIKIIMYLTIYIFIFKKYVINDYEKSLVNRALKKVNRKI